MAPLLSPRLLAFLAGLLGTLLSVALACGGHFWRSKPPAYSLVMLAAAATCSGTGFGGAVWGWPRLAAFVALAFYASFLGLGFLLLALLFHLRRANAATNPHAVIKALLSTGLVLALAPWLALGLHGLLFR